MGGYSTLNGIQHIRELYCERISRSLYDRSMGWINQVTYDFPIGGEGLGRLSFIFSDEATVSFHIQA